VVVSCYPLTWQNSHGSILHKRLGVVIVWLCWAMLLCPIIPFALLTFQEIVRNPIFGGDPRYTRYIYRVLSGVEIHPTRAVPRRLFRVFCQRFWKELNRRAVNHMNGYFAKSFLSTSHCHLPPGTLTTSWQRHAHAHDGSGSFPAAATFERRTLLRIHYEWLLCR